MLTIGLLGLVMVLNGRGQGQVDFRNSNLTNPGNRFVYDADQVTKLAGPEFLAQLYYSTGQNGIYVPVADPAVPFRALGVGDGFWNPGASSTRDLPGTVGGQNVFLLVRVWTSSAGATWEAAFLSPAGRISDPYARGFAYTTGGDPRNGNPPLVPPAMNGFESFAFYPPIPEPSTIVLGILGAGLLRALRFNSSPNSSSVNTKQPQGGESPC